MNDSMKALDLASALVELEKAKRAAREANYALEQAKRVYARAYDAFTATSARKASKRPAVIGPAFDGPELPEATGE